ncbi:MAG: hypothetical protein U9N87_09505, partial [Planctomycetota bacterium]|nr:hypothetical protein [Planctomycetota bacterium]
MRAYFDNRKSFYGMGRFVVFILGFCSLAVAGCGDGSATKVVEGQVSVAGQKADRGDVRFIPIEDTSGPTNAATIVDGKYRIEARGGVPLGKYRVEVVATRKTGRQVMQDTGFERAMGDEYITIS